MYSRRLINKPFLSTPSARRATFPCEPPYISTETFLSTPSARRATGIMHETAAEQKDFYPRPPRGGRRPHSLRRCRRSNNFYPRPPRGGRRLELCGRFGAVKISIHALREEGDVKLAGGTNVTSAFLSTPSARRATACTVLRDGDAHISIHALREEGDDAVLCRRGCLPVFLSTPSARRATLHAAAVVLESSNFYPRPPRGGRPGRVCCGRALLLISIHALREEGDLGKEAVV